MQATDASRVRVRAGARLHLGLLDLSGESGRLYGGVGCMLEEPFVEMWGSRATKMQLRGVDAEDELAVSLARKLEEVASVLDAKPIQLTVTRRLPSHSGFGSSTATVLAALALLVRLNSLDVPAERVAALSGRGGVSGTGVHGFFQGGWIVDAGQPPGTPAVPSRFSRHQQPSLFATRIPPPDWPVGLFLVEGRTMSGESEAAFFQANAQRAGRDAHRCVSVAHHKIVPGLLTADLELVADGVTELSGCGFKQLELRNQPPAVHQLMARLRSCSPVVGMSSMGPLVYAIGGDDTKWQAIADQLGAWHTRTAVTSAPAELTWQN